MAGQNKADISPDIIGKKLKEALQALDRSPAWLAEQTGISVRTLYSILNGHHLASPEKLRAICQALHMSLDALFDLECNVFPLFPEPDAAASRTYATFESIWLGEKGGERISVSRHFSIAHQSEQLREEILRHVYKYSEEQVAIAMEAFRDRQRVIREREKSRLEIVVKSEIEDFIRQREPFDVIEPALIHECIEGVINRLENDPLRLEIVVIPRQFFLVNYEIINREVILFDMGTVFLRQTHPMILQHFLREVEQFKTQRAVYKDRASVVEFLRENLERARKSMAHDGVVL